MTNLFESGGIMRQFVRTLLLTVVIALCAGWAFAQVPTGTPPFSSSTSTGGPEAIDLANLNVHLDIPVVNKAGREVNFTYDLSYDSSVWQVLWWHRKSLLVSCLQLRVARCYGDSERIPVVLFGRDHLSLLCGSC